MDKKNFTIKDFTVKELEKKILFLSEKYHNDIPIVEDVVYDSLVDILKIKNPDSKILKQIGAPVRTDIEKAKLPVHLGGIVTKKHQREIDLWKNKHKGEYMISSKLDGISGLIILDPKNNNTFIYTRGDGDHGQDVSYLAEYLNLIPDKYTKKIIIRGEFVMKKSIYEKKYSHRYKKNRTLVSSIFNSKKPDIDIINNIDFVAHEKIDNTYMSFSEQFKELKTLGINIVEHKIVKDFTFESLEKTLAGMRTKSIYEMDGIVISQNNVSKRYKDGDPKYTFAFKINQGYRATVKDVIWNPTRNGILVPKVEIEPIKIQGDTVTFSTGFNAKYIVDNSIGKGTEIIITKSGDVIPYIMSITKATTAKMPSGEVNYRWTESNINIELVNTDVEEVNKKKLLHFFRTLEVPFVSEGTINKFYQNNYRSIKKIYNMSIEDMLELDGIKEKNADKFYTAIHDTLDSDIDLAKLMHASMSFNTGMGEKRFNLVIDKYGENFDVVEFDDLVELDGFSEIISNFYMKGLVKFKKFLKENNYLNFYIEDLEDLEDLGENTDSKFAVFSGFRDKELEKILRDKGIQVVDNLNKNVDFLIVKDKENETLKTKKAKRLGIKIVEVDYFIK